jgi:hypothetical protein
MADTQRYWDGSQWTAHVAPTMLAATAPPAIDESLTWVLPVGRSGAAIAAGYVGIVAIVFAVLGWAGVVVGVVAIGLGIWGVALSRSGRKGAGRAIFAIVAGVIGIVGGVLTVPWYW